VFSVFEPWRSYLRELDAFVAVGDATRVEIGMQIVREIRPWVLVLSLLVLPQVAHAQMELAVMQGVVRDEAGQPLADVSFRIRDVDRGREVVVKSDKSGRSYRRGLQAVEYELTVEKEGYQSIKDRVKLTAGMDRRFDFKLVKAAPAGAGEFAEGVKAFNAGNFAAAATSFEAAVQKQPELPELRVNLALAYYRLSRTPDAVAQLEKAASLAPNDPHVQFQLGSAYVELKDLPKATAALEQGLARVTDTKDPLVFDAHITLAAVYFASNAPDKAQQQYEQALALRADAPAALLGLGKVQFSRNNPKEALATFERLVAAHPGTPEATEAQTFISELKK
jgi:Tfp pilus assembly protein PilF